MTPHSPMPRVVEPEWMDQCDLDESEHRQALRALSRINWCSFAAQQFWPEIDHLASAFTHAPVRVLDVACGGGDVSLKLASMAANRKVAMEIDGCDINPFSVQYATEQARQRGLQVGYFRQDALGRLPEGYDVIICSLFLHHLQADQIVALLREMKSSARRMILVSDLIRSRNGLFLSSTAPLLLTRSPNVHRDSVRSVRAALTINDVQTFAAEAGLTGSLVRPIWPERFMLVWRR